MLVSPTQGYEDISNLKVHEMYSLKNIAAIVGSPFYCRQEAKLAELLNRFMISYVSMQTVMIFTCYIDGVIKPCNGLIPEWFMASLIETVTL